MKNAILVHGICDKEEFFSDKYPSLSNSHWFPWLQKQLLINNIYTQSPEMPEPYSPVYEIWKKEFERYDVNKDSLLVGHSAGAGFLIRWLIQQKVKVEKLVLVAPWLDPNKTLGEFLDFEIEPEVISGSNEIHILFSSNDDKEVINSTNIIIKNVAKAIVHDFKNKGHFTYDDLNSEKFPELSRIVI